MLSNLDAAFSANTLQLWVTSILARHQSDGCGGYCNFYGPNSQLKIARQSNVDANKGHHRMLLNASKQMLHTAAIGHQKHLDSPAPR